ncbi:uncharacterized protein J4E84_006743 [Alternaria hordeiaustralica]|uniref:uncharacterized protein n=1 Tax=Alternaria hordeiaustralica TaxID=1187925 RepID=UPI0020C3ABC8|nr:uncharacterized protein J4E84_006743 [Alternaria hordeiaustralica]KAI4683903.1 hypothetical protein J4E84_006743 [Alternaria hordeiaustralica]
MDTLLRRLDDVMKERNDEIKEQLDQVALQQERLFAQLKSHAVSISEQKQSWIKFHNNINRLSNIVDALGNPTNDDGSRTVDSISPRIYVSLKNELDYLRVKNMPSHQVVNSLRAQKGAYYHIRASHVNDRNPGKRELVLTLDSWTAHDDFINKNNYEPLRRALGTPKKPLSFDCRSVERTHWVSLTGWTLPDKTVLNNYTAEEEKFYKAKWSEENDGLKIDKLKFSNGTYLLWGFATVAEAFKACKSPLYFEGTVAIGKWVASGNPTISLC